MTIAGQPHIAFHTVRAFFERQVIGSQRMFRASGRTATVGNHKRVLGEHLVDPRHDHYAAGSCPSNSTGAADAASAGRSGPSLLTTIQRCAGRWTGLRSNPSKTRATA